MMKRVFMKLMLSMALACMLSTGVCAGDFQVIDGRIRHDSEEIKLFGVSWFGGETADHVPHGLWSRGYKEMISQIEQLGFNAIRLPFCPGTMENVETGYINHLENPDLQGLKSLEIFDKIMEELDRQQIYILLDHHRPDCNAISELWYTDTYSEQAWIEDLVMVADRYKDLEYFLGIDIKNEPHGSATWGTGNERTDWDHAAARAAEAILAVNPNLLIFVEGIQENTSCSSSTNHWWGGNLEPQACYPLDIPASKLVLSPHVYGPDVYAQPYFSDTDFPENMPFIWETHFGFLVNQGYVVAPGEFGGKYGHGGDSKDVTWQDSLIDYFVDKRICNFFYWSWNPNSGDTGGILQDDWTNIWQDKYNNLKRLMDACGLDIQLACADGVDNDGDGLVDMADPGCESLNDNDESDEPPMQYACGDGLDNDGDGLIDMADPGCENTEDNDEYNTSGSGLVDTQVNVTDDWGTGYCTTVAVTNGTSETITWAVTVEMDGTVTDLWNGEYTTTGSAIDVRGASWNKQLAPEQSTSFGFCANRDEPPMQYACGDGLDNDGDGLIDMADPGCENTEDNDEYNAPNSGDVTGEAAVTNDWGTGYCANILIKNNGDAAVDWQLTLTIQGTITTLWNALYEIEGNTLTIEGLDWNNVISAGETNTSVGFCAVR